MYYRSQLDPRLHKAYDKIKADLLAYSKTASFPIDFAVDFDIIDDLYQAVLFDNPNLYFVGKKFNIGYGPQGEVIITPTYDKTKANVALYNKRLKSIETKILSLVTGNNTYEKVVSLHDVFCRNITYKIADDCFSIIGALVKREAVCEGIAKAFKYFCNLLRIPCVVIIGYDDTNSKDDVGHAWVKVRVDKVWYNIDISHDVGLSNQRNAIAHDFLFVSDASLRNHRITRKCNLPCLKDDLNDVYKNKCVAKNPKELYKIFCEKLSSNVDNFIFKMENITDLQRAQNNILQVLQKAVDATQRSISPSLDINSELLLFNLIIKDI